jgi:hypothetical protein
MKQSVLCAGMQRCLLLEAAPGAPGRQAVSAGQNNHRVSSQSQELAYDACPASMLKDRPNRRAVW